MTRQRSCREKVEAGRTETSRRFFRSADATPFAQPKDAVDLDELSLKRELSDLCHSIGVADWEKLMKAIFDWIAEAKSSERVKRLAAVNELLRAIRKLSRYFEALARPDPEELPDENRKTIQTLLTSFITKQQIRKESDH